ncbi:MAG TPA: glycoside hydrolase domain-containing protein [Clostridia bacterium]
MKKIRLIVLFLSLIFIFNITANKAPANYKAEANDSVEFWSVPSTEKVLQDKTDIYQSIKKEAKVYVEACKGEYESTQIIMTANKDVKSVTLSYGELNGDNGAKFSKDNISVYYELYTNVTNIYDSNGAPTGLYPDALVPFDKIVEAKENTIKANTNQGLFVTFNVPIDQAAGKYTGTLEITYDGTKKTLPVELVVYDLKVNEETHSRSKFNSTFTQYLGELDSTQEMFDAYIQKMIEYRISPSYLINGNHLDKSQAMIDLYVEKAYTWAQNPRMSNFNIPAYTATDSTTNEKTIDKEMLIKYVNAILKKSFETGFNLMGRAIFSTGIIDEPDLFGLMARVPIVMRDYDEAITTCINNVNSIIGKLKVDAAFKEEVINSLKNMSFVVTMPYNESVKDIVTTWCPYASEYDTEEKRKLYEDQVEKWWYTCVAPRAPHPTYHIEDTLISARALSWMMSEYNVRGNLFWAVDVYAKYNGSSYQFIDDFYSTPERYPRANGDGFLFYPGARYGIFGPLSSMRMEAIRDGNEEYELFYNLKADYQAMGINTETIIRNINSLIYTGTRVASNSTMFQTARKALIELSMLAQSDAKVCVVDVIDDTYGNITYKVFAKSGYEIFSDAISSKEVVEKGTIYTISVNLNKDSNVMSFYTVVNGKTLSFNFNIGGKTTVSNAEAISSGFTKGTVSVTSSLVDAATVDGTQGKYVKLDIAQAVNKHQSITWTNDVLKTVNSSTSKIILHIFNPSQQAIPFKLYVKYSGVTINTELVSTTLQPGMNVVKVEGINSFNWTKYKSIENAMMYFSQDSASGGEARTVYIKDFVAYSISK